MVGLSATRNYTYDNIDRLTGMTDGTNTESYSYDSVGNRTASHLSSSYTYGSVNRLTATNSATYSYNSNGNRTGRTSSTWTYGWDRENRLISAGAGLTSVSYAYDALGRRVKRTQGSNVLKYTYDGQDVVLDDLNSTITTYQNGPGIDNKLKTKTGSTSQYYLQNHLGSTVALTNSSGAVNESQAYDSFGNRTITTFSNRYQFTGREYDPTTGLQYSRARWYDPQLGRFISEDPIGFGGGDVNFYGYVSNNSQNFADPSGLIPTGAEIADYWQEKIRVAKEFYGYDPPIGWRPDTGTMRLFESLENAADPLRVGQGVGCAIYADGLQDYERFDLIARDVVRAGDIALYLAIPAEPRFEFKPNNNWRFAPLGNRTGHPLGELPHYHRRGLQKSPGVSVDGQGIGRHRPWEVSKHDKSFWDRF